VFFRLHDRLRASATWPAIWMFPTDWVFDGWAAFGEIDIMEAVNLKSQSDAADAEDAIA